MLDVDYGSYPVSLRQFALSAYTSAHGLTQFVTSSSTTLAGIIGGLTLNPKNITETVGVVKACMSIAPRSRFTADQRQIPPVSGREPSRPKIPKSAS